MKGDAAIRVKTSSPPRPSRARARRYHAFARVSSRARASLQSATQSFHRRRFRWHAARLHRSVPRSSTMDAWHAANALP